MSYTTPIQWTEMSWSPWMGCRQVSVCCDNCYISETPALRFRGIKHGSDRVRTAEDYWQSPLRWNRKAGKEGMRYRVFPSLCDPFDEEVPEEWRQQFFGLIANTPNLDWLLLTKRPQAAKRFAEDLTQMAMVEGEAQKLWYQRTGEDPSMWFAVGWPLDNVWLGVSVGCQADADKWIPILLRIPAKVRFLSVEPMLEFVDLSQALSVCWLGGPIMAPRRRGEQNGINWVIYGGESGRNARPCQIGWIRDGLQQCKAAGVSAFVKQLGARAVCENWQKPTAFARVPLRDKKGGDPAEWPEDLRVREFPML